MNPRRTHAGRAQLAIWVKAKIKRDLATMARVDGRSQTEIVELAIAELMTRRRSAQAPAP